MESTDPSPAQYRYCTTVQVLHHRTCLARVRQTEEVSRSAWARALLAWLTCQLCWGEKGCGVTTGKPSCGLAGWRACSWLVCLSVTGLGLGVSVLGQIYKLKFHPIVYLKSSPILGCWFASYTLFLIISLVPDSDQCVEWGLVPAWVFDGFKEWDFQVLCLFHQCKHCFGVCPS